MVARLGACREWRAQARLVEMLHRLGTADGPLRFRIERLTPREREILELLAEGMRSKQIARELVISPKTVASHIQSVLAKLGVHSRAEAIAIAYKEGLVGESGISGETGRSSDFDTTAHAYVQSASP